VILLKKTYFRLLNLQYPNNCSVLEALKTIKRDQFKSLFFMNAIILMAWCIGQQETIESSKTCNQTRTVAALFFSKKWLYFLIEQRRKKNSINLTYGNNFL